MEAAAEAAGLISVLSLAGDVTVRPGDHVVSGTPSGDEEGPSEEGP
jgi:2-keto-4-pentenoate hydratase/2-oxohepta-3-ene-1,7-dioic acid hydratase in catechol pathway